MKKMIMVAAIVCAAAFANAATVGWTNAGLTNYKNDAYALFVIGQNNVTDIATVTAILDAGSDYSSYAFGSGTISTTGAASVAASASGKTLDAGTYQSFLVIFDAATPVSGSTKYTVVSGLAGQTINIGASTATKSFIGGNLAGTMSAASWNSFGSAGPIAPEPTSGLLLLLGMAGLALKRKHA